MRQALLAVAASSVAIGLAACTGAADAATSEESVDPQAGIQYLSDVKDGAIDAFECSALSEYNGIYLGDNSKVIEFFRSMPTGHDMVTFAILADQGTLVVDYPPEVTPPPNELLDPVLTALADCGREYVTNLETVRFMVPDGASLAPRDF